MEFAEYLMFVFLTIQPLSIGLPAVLQNMYTYIYIYICMFCGSYGLFVALGETLIPKAVYRPWNYLRCSVNNAKWPVSYQSILVFDVFDVFVCLFIYMCLSALSIQPGLPADAPPPSYRSRLIWICKCLSWLRSLCAS